MSTLAEKLRKLRKDKGLSLDEVAVATNGSKSYLWALETDNNKKPSADKLLEIAKFYGVSTDYLLNEDDDRPIDTAQKIFTRVSSLSEIDQKEIEKMIELIINMKKND